MGKLLDRAKHLIEEDEQFEEDFAPSEFDATSEINLNEFDDDATAEIEPWEADYGHEDTAKENKAEEKEPEEEESDEEKTSDEEDDDSEEDSDDEESDEEEDSDDEEPDEEDDSDDEESDDEEPDEEEDSDDEEPDEEEDSDDEESDEEDDSDDEESDEEDDFEIEDEEDEAEIRKRYRRTRRIRNQIIAYAIVLLVLAGIGAGLFYAGKAIGGYISAKKTAQVVAELQAEEPEEGEPAMDLVIETPEEPEEEILTKEGQLDSVVTTCIAEMPIEDKVAGLFIVTPEQLTGVSTVVQAGEGTKDSLYNYAVGGLIYSAKNIQDEEQLKGMLSGTQSMSKYPLFMGIKEQGGDNSVLAGSSVEVTAVDDAATIGATNDPSAAFDSGLNIGSYLTEFGFNLDFGPVADVVAEDAQNGIGNASYGNDATAVAPLVSNVISGIQGTGVSACMMSFPGNGSADADTAVSPAKSELSLDDFRTNSFPAFKAGIDVGCNMILVGNMRATGLDSDDVPSSMSSKIINDYLRGELGYEGIVIAGPLSDKAITSEYSSEEAVLTAIRSGADMILEPADFEAAYNALLEAVKNGDISEERIDESLVRIYRIKYADKL